MRTICKNCNNHFKGEFCPACGQTAHTHAINFKEILHEIQHSLFHVDKGILYTTKQLFTRPGHTIREYIDGKRIKHFKPIAYVLVLSTLYTLLTHLTHQESSFEKMLQGMTDGSKNDTDKSFALFIEIIQWLRNHYAYSTLIFIPITSFASYLAFVRTRYNYFQHIILNAFLAGQRAVLMLIVLPVTYIFKNQNVINTVDGLTLVAGIAFTFWAYFQFFNSTKPYKRIILTIFSYLLLMVLFFLLLLLIVAISKTNG